ncbi:MAG: hypothetical protein KJP08_04675 [Gammaproteobacteria bacterium]|mgnify:FL=1|nr:hypothetical protein [Gammaproteobacteria bacterium]NNF49137.1 hypothetical protein [Woeseiaceae bacterium]
MKTLTISLLFVATAVLIAACGRNDVSFADDVQPIFDRYCISCHAGTGEGAEVSAYVMTDYNGVMTGTSYGPVVVAGSRMSSSLYLVVAGKTAPEIRMPPHNDESFAEGRGVMLSADAIETIGLWIDQGARNN